MEWHKDIPGYEGLYAVSLDGRVFSYRAGRHLKLCTTTKGHLSTQIDGKTVYAHNLVLITFVGPRPDRHVGRHLDGNCLNNDVFNLDWGTNAQNMQDKKWHGKARKLSVDQVREIKARIARGDKHGPISRDYGVAHSNINAIARGVIHIDV